ncbi:MULTISPECIES: signal peptidase I [unclassified Bacillus (in: firmicutes)]|uniref:signal peptidase I n=1 Tax=unclassified Bacillus (in: firmicutes) TaxID=185979 RepID=UPI0008EEF49F|nr:MULTISPECIES: signal peptidase I [unclassified Bacillus (in: firmicutes)]SFA99936.1 signal peptidase I [Bacillus sp. UNCCL13]SFQ81871.1 signal peptidase I [Bacillus sp. cl95]
MTKKKNETFEWVKSILGALVIAFIIRSFIFTPIVVDGESMNPTLQDKDRMVVIKIGEPKRFDIVVFHAPDGRDYIKRVIGLPGDSIEYKNDVLYINGKAYNEPYLEKYKKRLNDETLTYSFTLKETAVGSDTVPKDSLFVMGDNRRDSKDSRDIGAIPIEKVIGTTNVVYYPIKEIKIVNN